MEFKHDIARKMEVAAITDLPRLLPIDYFSNRELGMRREERKID